MIKAWRRPILAVCALGCTLFLAGCGDSENSDELIVHRHALDGSPSSLDPEHSSTLYANHLVLNIYDTLYAYQYLARPYQLKPNLAVDLPEVSDDGLTYTIRMKPGTRFADDKAFSDGQGREVTAHDVVYSLLRHFDPASQSQGSWLWQGLFQGMDEWAQSGADYDTPPAGLQAVDNTTLQIRLNKPYPQFVHTLALGFAGIVPREAVELYGHEFGVRPVGSGPFELMRFNSVKAVLEPNPYFRQEPVSLSAEGYDPATQSEYGLEAIDGRSPPFIDRLEFHFVVEDTARWSSMLKGDEIDYARIPAIHFEDVLAQRQPIEIKPEIDERFHVLPFVEPGFVRTDFNMADPAVGYHPDAQQNERNKALRCALVKAFDWQTRNDVLYYGIAKLFPGVIPPVTPEYDPNMSQESLQHDPSGAQALLSEYGWNAENLPALEYGFMNSVTNRQYYEQMRSFFEGIGYPREKVEALVFPSFGDLNQAARESRVMLYFSGWNMDYPDAQNTMQLYYGPNRAPGANTANYQNPEYDRLYEQASVMQASPERTELYRQMNQMLVDDCVSITGLTRTMLLMWNKDMVYMPDRSFAAGYSLRYVDRRRGDNTAESSGAQQH